MALRKAVSCIVISCTGCTILIPNNNTTYYLTSAHLQVLLLNTHTHNAYHDTLHCVFVNTTMRTTTHCTVCLSILQL